MAERNSVDTTSDPRAIITTRVFDAPRELVFAAWTHLEHLKNWWGPNGFTTTTHAIDICPGGVWRFVMHGPDGRDYENRITFDEIKSPERLVYHHGGGDDVEPVRFHTTVTFEDIGGKTKLTMHAVFPSMQMRDEVIKNYHADKGALEHLARLAQHLTTMIQKIGQAGEQPMSQEFVITRTFDAPRELVWAAWTDAKHLKEWFGPKGFKIVACDLDLKPGGVFHYGMQAPDGNIMWGKWTFREINPPKELVVVTSFSDKERGVTRHPMSATWPLETLSRTTFTEENGKTILTVRWTAINASETERSTFDAAHDGMTMGFTGTFEQLDAYLAAAQGK